MSGDVRYYEATDKEKSVLVEKLRTLVSREERILVAFVYGGFTRRKFFRDIDLAVYTGGTVLDYLHFESRLCNKMSKIIGVYIDVRIIDDAPAWFRLKVAREGLLIYEKLPGAYTLFIKETVGDYQDLKIKQSLIKSRSI
ncbi:MAG: hypothetical protein DRJ64_03740 [Thermoprotei archaeon]|nr:MAG: hypothetical protein DRJ64_03740 [Thermoprotei archaeon]